MSIAAVLFLLCALGLFVWLRYRDLIGAKTFSVLAIVWMLSILIIVMRPDMLEVNIRGNTLKALRQETDRAQETLSALRKLRYDMLSVEFKSIASSRFLVSSATDVKAEEFDQFMFLLEILPRKEQLDEELREDVTQACEAVLSRQHLMTGMHFVFSESQHEFVQGGGFSRADLWPYEENFRTLTSDEIEAELDELHRKIDDTPGQSLENDKNRELRLEAVENYKRALTCALHLLMAGITEGTDSLAVLKRELECVGF